MDDIKDPAPSDASTGAASRIHNRQMVVAAVAEKASLPRATAQAAVEAVFESVRHALSTGKEVRILGFGTFVVSDRKASKGRDPRTGEEIDIPESKSVRFRPGSVLREQVDAGKV